MRTPGSAIWAAAVLLFNPSLASGLHRDDYQTHPRECTFTLSATGDSFSYLVGQLEDGTIRLSGPQPPAIFFIDEQNGITDSDGFYCSVADDYGLQCQSSKPSVQELTIDASFFFLYQDSPQFYACPVDSTGYGIFGQRQGDENKCISITLITNSSCADVTPPSSKSSWQASTVPGPVSSFKSSHVESAHNIRPRTLAQRDICPDTRTRSRLNKRGLHKRTPGDLNRCWEHIRDTSSNHFVKQNSVLTFPLNMGTDDIFATSEYYGCTVIVFVGRGGITIAHLPEGSGSMCPLSNAALTDKYINDNLFDKVRIPESDACDDLYVVITCSEPDNGGNNGVATLKRFIIAYYGVLPKNLRYIYYRPGPSTSEFGSPRTLNPVNGRSFFRWSAYGVSGIMTIYLGNEAPRLTAHFNSDWTPAAEGPTFGQSPYTTDGNDVQA